MPDPAASAPLSVAMQGVRFTWPGPRGFTMAIDRFELDRGERLLLTGPSGSGKSTFLSLLCGTVQPAEGTIAILGHDIARLSSRERDRFRAEHFGIVFQMFNLLPYATVTENVLLPLAFAPGRRMRACNDGAPAAEAVRLLSRLGLDASLAERGYASSLSVGQQQRVAAARALIGKPELIVADEPTSALDSEHRAAFLQLLFDETERAGATLIVVSHDETMTRHFARVERLDSFARTSTRSAP